MVEKPFLCACQVSQAEKCDWKQVDASGEIKVQGCLELDQGSEIVFQHGREQQGGWWLNLHRHRFQVNVEIIVICLKTSSEKREGKITYFGIDILSGLFADPFVNGLCFGLC